MQWSDLPKFELFEQLKAKSLEHPTSAAFDAGAWITALGALTGPTERDVDLAMAAIYFGTELARLRRDGIPLTTVGFDRSRLVRLLAAFANQQFLTLRKKLRLMLKAGKRGGLLDLERAQQVFITNTGGQEMAPDDLVTFLVDSLPNWLFHIWTVADDAPSDEPAEAIRFAARASEVVSIEHSLRQLWQNALWVGTTLTKDGDATVDSPRNRELAERWFVYDQREMMLLGFEANIEAGAMIVSGGKLPPVVPAIRRTVIRMERPRGGRRRFVTGRASGARREQRDHVSERDMLERLYVGLFLDELLPRSPGGSLTCRELSAAWWVLKDLANLAADDLGEAWMADDRAVGRFALSIDAGELARIFADCLAVDEDRALGVVDWFTCDPADTSRLFAKSFWSQPLLPQPGSERRHILLAPLMAGSPLKRVEAWMERGGISDSRGVKGRGKPFERHVRRELAGAIAGNALLTDSVVAEHGLKRKGGSEEIDLLIRIGDAVVVGEVKCFVAPSEPLENHNHLGNLAKATAQAEKKRAWAEANRDVLAAALGVVDPARIAALRVHLLVVLNNGFGMGLERDGIPIVDLHYLTVLLGGGSYNAGARFERGIGAIYDSVELYRSQPELEAGLADLLRAPPPLKRFRGALRWRRLPFRTSTGRPFFIELPALSEEPMPNPLRDLPASPGRPGALQPARRSRQI